MSHVHALDSPVRCSSVDKVLTFPVRQQIAFKLATLAFKAMKLRQPAYLGNILREYLPTRNLRLSAADLSHQTLATITFSSRSFSVAAFYARKQLLLSTRLSHYNSVCLSVRLSHGWISQKRCKLGSPNLYHRCLEMSRSVKSFQNISVRLQRGQLYIYAPLQKSYVEYTKINQKTSGAARRRKKRMAARSMGRLGKLSRLHPINLSPLAWRLE